MKNFTVEELNLMCCFNTSSRKRLIDDMKSVTLNDMDGEIAELMYKTVRKLEAMTDGTTVYPVQQTKDGAIVYAENLPSKGYQVLRPTSEAAPKTSKQYENVPRKGRGAARHRRCST